MKPVVTKRRSLTPMAGIPPVAPGAHAMRRGTVRREMTERVMLRTASGVRVCEGWALNGSRGGLRAILETQKADEVELGGEYQITIGDFETGLTKRARIVWLQEEPDGVVVGLEFVSVSGLHRGVAPPAPDGAEVIADGPGIEAAIEAVIDPAIEAAIDSKPD